MQLAITATTGWPCPDVAILDSSITYAVAAAATACHRVLLCDPHIRLLLRILCCLQEGELLPLRSG